MWERDGHVCVDLHAHSKGVMLVREKHKPHPHTPPGSSNLSAPSLIHTEGICKAQVGTDCWQGSEIQSGTRLAKGSLEHPRRVEDSGWWTFPNTRSRKKWAVAGAGDRVYKADTKAECDRGIARLRHTENGDFK